MERRDALLVDAFTETPLSGNVAGVVPEATGLDAEQMRAVAAELGASETAFVRPGGGEADWLFRYFTPETEVDLCGHATVAAGAALAERGLVTPGTHAVETNGGVRDLTVDEDGTVWMAGDEPSARQVDLDPDRLADALGVDPVALLDDPPVAVASAGLPFLLVGLNYQSALRDADPDEDAVASCCRAVDATGLYAYTFDTLTHDATAHGRAFVPLAGLPEDPVTGTASAAAAVHLRRSGAVETDEFVFEQGHVLDRPGRVAVRTDGRPRVGGRATVSLSGTITIPASGDTDILEG
ncbi:MAG: PhzF family phenazine biosynthesis protein [Haloarculaceae archaeon]